MLCRPGPRTGDLFLGSRLTRPAPLLDTWGVRIAAVGLGLLLLLLASEADAQQSLFNAPAGHRTHEGGFFAQEQLNLARSGESNLTLDYGIGAGFEAGINVFHVDVYSDGEAGSARDLVMANAVLTRPLSSWLAWQVGGQMGGGRHGSDWDHVGFGWPLLEASGFHEHVELVAGGYAADRDYLGPGSLGGGLVGVEIVLVHQWLDLQADWILGTNEASVAVAGLCLFLPRGWQIAAGVQLPSPGSDNHFGAVVELTRTPLVHP